MGVIEDGTGEGLHAKVNASNELHVRARGVPRISEVTKNQEESYYLHSGFVNLTTTGSFSGIIYVKNNSAKDLCLQMVRTCGNQVQQWEWYRNPTAGTLISGGTAKTPQNLNFSANKDAAATVLAGSDGATVTDGTLAAHWINDVGHSSEMIDGAVMLGSGNSLALMCKPAAAGAVCVTILAWFEG
jgi:hypothetical protein